MRAALMVYGAGVFVGLWRTDAKPVERLVLAVLWPLGPLAFLVTIAILLAASPFAFVRRS